MRKTPGDGVLRFGKVCIVGLEPVSPNMRPGFGLDKLYIDSHSITGPPYASFQHVPDTQFAANLFGVNGFALVGEGGVAGDNEAAGNPREIGCQVIGDPVSEILLLGIA